MRIISNLFIVLVVAAIAVVLITTVINFYAGSIYTPPADTANSAEMESPTLRAPPQEIDTSSLPEKNLNAMVSLFGFIGVIGIMVIIVNHRKKKNY